MNINPNPKVRLTLYVLTALATPIVAYLKFKGYIGDAEALLWSAEVSVVSLMAGFNVTTTK